MNACMCKIRKQYLYNSPRVTSFMESFQAHFLFAPESLIYLTLTTLYKGVHSLGYPLVDSAKTFIHIRLTVILSLQEGAKSLGMLGEKTMHAIKKHNTKIDV